MICRFKFKRLNDVVSLLKATFCYALVAFSAVSDDINDVLFFDAKPLFSATR